MSDEEERAQAQARRVALTMFIEAIYVLGTFNGINCCTQLGPMPAKELIEPQFMQALALLQPMQGEFDERCNVVSLLRYLKRCGMPDVAMEGATPEWVQSEWKLAFEKFQAMWVTVPIVAKEGGIGRG
jgi:hypothetical protein